MRERIRGVGMRCPECGAAVKNGRLRGLFQFEPNAKTQARQRNVPDWYVALEARAEHCERCRWSRIDCQTLVVRRRWKGRWEENVAGPTECFCPDCGQSLLDGIVRGNRRFQASDAPSPGFWRTLFLPTASIRARAPARRCVDCGWCGVSCSAFVEPVFQTIGLPLGPA